MKVISVLFWFSSSALACPSLSGIFQDAPDVHMGRSFEFKQEGCSVMKLRACWAQPNGTLNCGDRWESWKVDGSVQGQCIPRASCRTYQYQDSALLITETKDDFLTKTEHGLCKFREIRLSMDANRNLVDTTKVFGCEDGFSGDSVNVWKRLK